MSVTLNIILEKLRHYRIESHIDEAAEITFRQARLLDASAKAFGSDFLYVGLLSDALSAAKRARGAIFLCVCDQDMSEHKRDHYFPSIMLVRESITPAGLLDEVQEIFLTISEWVSGMQEAVISKNGIQEILDLSEAVIGNFISINDSALSLLAYTKGIPTDDEVSLFLIENGYHAPETVKNFKRHKRFDLWFNSNDIIITPDRYFSKYIVVSRVFVHDETNFTNVVMSCNHRELSPGLLDLFKCALIYLGHYIESDLKERRSSIYASLIADLMNGKITDPVLAAERAKSVGFLPNAETAVMLLSETGDTHIVFSDRIARDISQRFQYIKPVNYNQRLLLLLNHPNIPYYMGDQGIGRRLDEFLRENNIFCGVSDTIDSLLELPDAYLQAEFALDNRKHISVFGKSQAAGQRWGNIVLFDEHYAEFLLNHSSLAERIWRSSKYGKMLFRLYKSDLEKHTNNLFVLSTFLINERRATETAAATYMHRNNVLYRIGRIEELLDIRLDDPATRLNLLMTILLFGETISAPLSAVSAEDAESPEAERAETASG